MPMPIQAWCPKCRRYVRHVDGVFIDHMRRRSARGVKWHSECEKSGLPIPKPKPHKLTTPREGREG